MVGGMWSQGQYRTVCSQIAYSLDKGKDSHKNIFNHFSSNYKCLLTNYFLFDWNNKGRSWRKVTDFILVLSDCEKMHAFINYIVPESS